MHPENSLSETVGIRRIRGKKLCALEEHAELRRLCIESFCECLWNTWKEILSYFENMQTESACELKIPGIKLCIFTEHMTVT